VTRHEFLFQLEQLKLRACSDILGWNSISSAVGDTHRCLCFETDACAAPLPRDIVSIFARLCSVFVHGGQFLYPRSAVLSRHTLPHARYAGHESRGENEEASWTQGCVLIAKARYFRTPN
jgi:hypothetical protein